MSELEPSLILDTENLLWQFGYQTPRDWSDFHNGRRPTKEIKSKIRRWNDEKLKLLQQTYGPEFTAEEIREAGLKIVFALLFWFERTFDGLPGAGYSVGKWNDPSFHFSRDAFEALGLRIIEVPSGEDMADRECIRLMYWHLDQDSALGQPVIANQISQQLRSSQRRVRQVIGSEDHKIWREVLEVVDSANDPGMHFTLISADTNRRSKNWRKLFDTAYWPDPLDLKGERRVLVEVTPEQRTLRQLRIEHRYLNDIVIPAKQEAKRTEKSRRSAKRPSADRPTIKAKGRRPWIEIIARVEETPLTPPSSGGLSRDWEKAAHRELLEAVVLDQSHADAAWSLIGRVREGLNLELIRPAPSDQVIGPLVGYGGANISWQDFLFIAIWIPLRVPDWDYPRVPSQEEIAKMRSVYESERANSVT